MLAIELCLTGCLIDLLGRNNCKLLLIVFDKDKSELWISLNAIGLT